MSEHRLELADVFRIHEDDFRARWGVAGAVARAEKSLRGYSRLPNSRSWAGHVEQYDCGHRVPLYNSCTNRSCPKCQAAARAKWLAERGSGNCLPVDTYFHVVFTLPQEELPTWHIAKCESNLPHPFSRSLRDLDDNRGGPPAFGRRDWLPGCASHLGARISTFTLTHSAWHYHMIDFQRTSQIDFPVRSPLAERACLSVEADRVMLRTGSASRSERRISQGARAVTCSRFNRLCFHQAFDGTMTHSAQPRGFIQAHCLMDQAAHASDPLWEWFFAARWPHGS